jgi:hypothetical protein
MTRVIVSAGHEHCHDITAERIGAQSAARLRTSTGALGREADWTGPWADLLATRLRAAGVEVARTGACFEAAYERDADLLVCGHCDGIVGRDRPQHCMAAAVETGAPTPEAQAQARSFVTAWYARYPAATGIAGNGPITTNMTQYYGGYYRTPATPMVLIEHGVLGDAGGWRADIPTPEEAAIVMADIILAWLGVDERDDPDADLERHAVAHQLGACYGTGELTKPYATGKVAFYHSGKTLWWRGRRDVVDISRHLQEDAITYNVEHGTLVKNGVF